MATNAQVERFWELVEYTKRNLEFSGRKDLIRDLESAVLLEQAILHQFPDQAISTIRAYYQVSLEEVMKGCDVRQQAALRRYEEIVFQVLGRDNANRVMN